LGYELLKNDLGNDDVFRIAAAIALEHHENYDGSGYPYGKKGNEISLYAQIVALADKIDAVASDRPYKKGWSKEDIEDYIERGMDKLFDRKLAQHALNNLDEIYEITEQY
jgi:HD-GYP domain-containing protein (c-di-GMP phosphodiesterase class II)